MTTREIIGEASLQLSRTQVEDLRVVTEASRDLYLVDQFKKLFTNCDAPREHVRAMLNAIARKQYVMSMHTERDPFRCIFSVIIKANEEGVEPVTEMTDIRIIAHSIEREEHDGLVTKCDFAWRDGAHIIREERIITFKTNVIKCDCVDFRKIHRCAHVAHSIRVGIDAPMIAKILDREELGSLDMSVPLFDVEGGMMYSLIRIIPRSFPTGRFGQINLFTPAESPAMPLEGTWSGAGDTYHRVGMVTGVDGREAIRAMVSAWVAAQDAMLEQKGVRLQCENHFHDQSIVVNLTDARERASLIITGNCLKCYTAEADVSRDVPRF